MTLSQTCLTGEQVPKSMQVCVSGVFCEQRVHLFDSLNPILCRVVFLLKLLLQVWVQKSALVLMERPCSHLETGREIDVVERFHIFSMGCRESSIEFR